MPFADFVHLRVHSAYSLSEGALKPKQLVELARRQQMPAVAVTDTGNLFGAMEFSCYAKDAGVQPIIGCLMSVTRPDEPEGPGMRPPPDQLLLLVQNEAGYRQPHEADQRCIPRTPSRASSRRSRCRTWRRTRKGCWR